MEHKVFHNITKEVKSMELEKPECKLIGENGNIFNLLGIASQCLKRAGLRDQASEMAERVFQSQSYDEALVIIGEYVDIY
jgi:hypothetical protein